MINFILSILKLLLPADPRLLGSSRSSQWPTVRKKHLEAHPYCENCGTDESVEVHHVIPFQIDKRLELDPKNLITLCEKHGCHFAAGHFFDWHSWNEDVREQAAKTLLKVIRRPKVEECK